MPEETAKRYSTSDHCSVQHRQLIEWLESKEPINLEELTQLLSHPVAPVFVNASCGVLQVRPLHLAAWRQIDTPNVVRLLLQYGAIPDYADKLGRTALHYCCIRGDSITTEILLKAGCDPNISQKVSLYGNHESFHPSKICREIPMHSELPTPECWGRAALHFAVKGGHLDCCRILLNYDALPNMEDERFLTPLQLAGFGLLNTSEPERIANYETIASLLISKGARADLECRIETTITTPLHTAVRLHSIETIKLLLKTGATLKGLIFHEAAETGILEIMELLLETEESDKFINSRNIAGCTPLHVAAYHGLPRMVHLLVKHGGDLSAQTDSYLSVVDAILINVPRPELLFIKIFDSALDVDDDGCINGPMFARNCKINVNFSFLAPDSSQHQMAVVRALLESCSQQQQVTFLEHPVLQGFLRLKWFRLRIFFIALVLMHIVHVLALSTYVCMLRSNHFTTDHMLIPGRILLICSTFLAIHCIIQTGLEPRHAFKDIENWIGIINSAFGLLIGVSAESEVEVPPPWLIHIMSGAVLLSWTHLMLITGRFALWGFYALMFYSVLLNVLKVLFTFCFLVFGFALSFALEFHQLAQFSDPGRSLVKTVAMVMGEFEYGELFKEDGQVEGVVPRILFLLFVVLAAIVLANLMVGLAVNDIQWIQTLGSANRLDKQSEFLAHLERLASHTSLKFAPQFINRFIYEIRTIPLYLEIFPGMGKSGMAGLSVKQIDKIVTIALRNHKEIHRKRKSAECTPCFSESEESTNEMDLLSILRDLQGQVNELHESFEWRMNSNQQSMNRYINCKIKPTASSKKLLKPSQSLTTVSKKSSLISASRKTSNIDKIV